jgi:hypothetical protein
MTHPLTHKEIARKGGIARTKKLSPKERLASASQ